MPVIWIHVSKAKDIGRYFELAEQIRNQHPDVTLKVTAAEGRFAGIPDETGMVAAEAPTESAVGFRTFLEACAPSLVLWGAGIAPNQLLQRANRMAIPVILSDFTLEAARARRIRLWSRHSKKSFQNVAAIQPRDVYTTDLLDQIGLDDDICLETGALHFGRLSPHVEDSTRGRFVQSLTTRPVWYAEAGSLEEIQKILTAHRAARRLLLGLLLILRPRSDGLQDQAAVLMRDAKLAAEAHTERDFPSQDAAVFVADRAGYEGLWYRVAPVAFLGGFDASDDISDPLLPANLGSAIVFGPHLKDRDALFHHLQSEGAAVQVNSPEGLTEAISQLSFPDRAAEMATKAWEFATRGSEATAQLLARVNRLMGWDVAGDMR